MGRQLATRFISLPTWHSSHLAAFDPIRPCSGSFDPTLCRSQSNSEHSRHWYFGGTIVVDGQPKPQTLFKMVKNTLKGSLCKDNSVIAFHDNSSSITGAPVRVLRPSTVGTACRFDEVRRSALALDNDDPAQRFHGNGAVRSLSSGGRHLPSNPHRRDAQLPVRRCTLSWGGDWHWRYVLSPQLVHHLPMTLCASVLLHASPHAASEEI